MKGEISGNKKWLELKASGRLGTKDLAAALLIEKGSPGVLEGFDERGKALVTGFIAASRREVLALLKQSLRAIGWRFDVSALQRHGLGNGMEKIPEADKGRGFFVKPTWKRVKRKRVL